MIARNQFRFRIISLLVLAFACCVSVANARVGETADECDKRYGEVIFKYKKSDFEHRSYFYQNKFIKCIFKNAICTWEIVEIGPMKSRPSGILEIMKEEAVPFYMGLLQEVYSFSQKDVEKFFSSIKPTERDVATSTIQNDKFKVVLKIYVDEKSAYVETKFQLNVIDEKSLGDDLAGFRVASMMAEMQSNNKKRASGF